MSDYLQLPVTKENFQISTLASGSHEFNESVIVPLIKDAVTFNAKCIVTKEICKNLKVNYKTLLNDLIVITADNTRFRNARLAYQPPQQLRSKEIHDVTIGKWE